MRLERDTQQMKALMENKSRHAAIDGIEISLTDWWKQIARRKTFVLATPIILGAAATAFSLLTPSTYKAATSILPRQPTQANAAAMLTQLGELSGSAAGALSIQVPIDPNLKIPLELHVSILKSRSVAENIVKRFNLESAYGKRDLEETRSKLTRNTGVQSGKDGLIRIEVEDTDPARAAEIANAYVEEHRAAIRAMALSESSQRRAFIERRLQTVREKMSKISSISGAVRPSTAIADSNSAPVRKTSANIARLRAEIAAKEVELGAFRAFSSAGTSDYENLQNQMLQLRAELAQYKGAKVTREGELATSTEMNNLAPDVQSQYYQVLLQLLEQQYQTAISDESSDNSLIQVLDKAVPPTSSDGPKRGLIITSAIVAGLFLGVFFVLIYDAFRENQRRNSSTL